VGSPFNIWGFETAENSDGKIQIGYGIVVSRRLPFSP